MACLRLCRAQRLRHAGTSRSVGEARALSDPSAQLCTIAAAGVALSCLSDATNKVVVTMSLFKRVRRWMARDEVPEHLLRGKLGEHAARKHLQRLGLKFLTSNYRSAHGEIDLIFRDQ